MTSPGGLQVSTPTAEPWDPQPGEPGTSFAGFVVYRETRAPQRSLRLVARRLARSLSLIERYSSKWDWVARTRAWEAEQARRRSQDALKVEADWVDRHIDAGKRMQAIGLAGLGQLFERDANGDRPGLRRMKPADYLRMLTAGAALEVTAVSHAAGTLEEDFVQRVIELVTAAFAEANRHDSEEARAAAFEAGCLRAVGALTS